VPRHLNSQAIDRPGHRVRRACDVDLDVARELAPEKDAARVDTKLELAVAVLSYGGNGPGHGLGPPSGKGLEFLTADGTRD
jgi:hypothetical protein